MMRLIERLTRNELWGFAPSRAADLIAVGGAAGRKHASRALALGLALLGLAGVPARAADTTQAEVACRPTAKNLAYVCTVTLRDMATNRPLEGIDLTVGADMPSMPMAHNVRPVKAKATSAAGVYEAEIELEMHGDWALRLRLAGPRTDLIVRPLRFEPGGARPLR